MSHEREWLYDKSAAYDDFDEYFIIFQNRVKKDSGVHLMMVKSLRFTLIEFRIQFEHIVRT